MYSWRDFGYDSDLSSGCSSDSEEQGLTFQSQFYYYSEHSNVQDNFHHLFPYRLSRYVTNVVQFPLWR